MIQNSPLIIAQVTDLHLFAEPDRTLLGLPTADSLSALLRQLRQLQPPPDFLLLTGDLSQDGTAASYEYLQAVLGPLKIPAYWLPGNHDDPEMMARSLTHPLFLPEKSFQAGSWQFLLLNSHVDGCVCGNLSTSSLDWLDRELYKNSQRPTLVSLHHPPFLTDSDWLDTSILQNPEDLFAVIDRHPQVELVVFGHIHQEFLCQREGVTYVGTPSTCIQFEPKSTHFALGSQEPGFRLLSLHPDGSWETEVRRIAYAHQLDRVAMGY
ncbi:MAG: 3',5'-cyclic-AMP phosphodiesterase [Leptolyngbyaceae cyanobacterium CSU_1_3]|nr:3',5'-cyclic-AMP phosphodiesterase [Leptolyngbyaceae cyanobacterium CSU_1_3]